MIKEIVKQARRNMRAVEKFQKRQKEQKVADDRKLIDLRRKKKILKLTIDGNMRASDFQRALQKHKMKIQQRDIRRQQAAIRRQNRKNKEALRFSKYQMENRKRLAEQLTNNLRR